MEEGGYTKVFGLLKEKCMKGMKNVKDAPIKYLVMYDEFANYKEGLY